MIVLCFPTVNRFLEVECWERAVLRTWWLNDEWICWMNILLGWLRKQKVGKGWWTFAPLSATTQNKLISSDSQTVTFFQQHSLNVRTYLRYNLMSLFHRWLSRIYFQRLGLESEKNDESDFRELSKLSCNYKSINFKWGTMFLDKHDFSSWVHWTQTDEVESQSRSCWTFNKYLCLIRNVSLLNLTLSSHSRYKLQRL